MVRQNLLRRHHSGSKSFSEKPFQPKVSVPAVVPKGEGALEYNGLARVQK